MPSSQLFLKDDHIRYFASALHEIPAPYAKLDSNRLTLVHFATHALDLLGVWDDRVAQDCLQIKPQRIIDWIHNLQLLQGFEGGSYVGPVSMSEEGSYNIAPNEYHQGHIAMTYTALCTLRTLGDDLSRINRQTILESMRRLQREDGSFQCTLVASEHDMRFLYCACAISYMLQDWSAVNIDLAVDYIRSCRAYDGGISLIPGQVRS